MDFERNDYDREQQNVHDECKKYLYYHAILTMTDGRKFDGIIENVDMDGITVLVGEDVMEKENENENENEYDQQRQYYKYNRPRRRFRHFRRNFYPIKNLAALALLPYITPPYPYYSNYPYY